MTDGTRPGLGRGRVTAPEIRKAVVGPAANVAAIAAGIGGDRAVGVDGDNDRAICERAGRGVDVVMLVERREGRLARAPVLVGPGP